MRWKPFLLLILIAILLWASWFIPFIQSFWLTLDEWTFRTLNGSLQDRPFVQIFWALASLHLSDLFGAVFIVTFTLLYAFDKAEFRQKRLAQFFYYLIWFELGLLFVKQVFSRTLIALQYLRDSPTLFFQDTILLSESCPWLKIKDSSHWCFPSDHAFIILEWVGFIWFFAGIRWGFLAFISSLIFILPRLIAGAHWLSDVLLGSLPLAICFIAVACFTPVYPFVMHYLERLTKREKLHEIQKCQL